MLPVQVSAATLLTRIEFIKIAANAIAIDLFIASSFITNLLRSRDVTVRSVHNKNNNSEETHMNRKLAVVATCFTSLSLAIAIVDTKPFDEPGYENIQRTVKCPAGQEYSQSARGCVPKR
jgi:hypothetical protein